MSIINLHVIVYRNLTRKTLSIKSIKTNRIIYYSDSILLENVTFKVSEAGRQRVLQTRHKNVHAVISGKVISTTPSEIEGKVVGYNPYKYDSFVYLEDLSNISSCNKCYINSKGLIIVN